MGRGLFIVFEGLDHSGKTTQCRDVAAALRLQGNVLELRFPDRTTKIGKECDLYLRNQSEKDDRNRWEFADTIRDTLLAGTTIICDRYAYSGVAYSAAKGLDVEWCKDPDRKLPAPDIVIYLEISVEDAAKRGNFGQERYEKAAFQEKVGAIFNQLKDDSFAIINALQQPGEVTKQILAAIEAKADAKEKSIASLWVEAETEK